MPLLKPEEMIWLPNTCSGLGVTLYNGSARPFKRQGIERLARLQAHSSISTGAFFLQDKASFLCLAPASSSTEKRLLPISSFISNYL